MYKRIVWLKVREGFSIAYIRGIVVHAKHEPEGDRMWLTAFINVGMDVCMQHVDAECAATECDKVSRLLAAKAFRRQHLCLKQRMVDLWHSFLTDRDDESVSRWLPD
ncbi:hypothetical protein KC727_02040 [Candidatus Kaiserbacteria bacterium]|nr:hypothetical protein [Candidatus Kaiserbacteria bacterium]